MPGTTSQDLYPLSPVDLARAKEVGRLLRPGTRDISENKLLVAQNSMLIKLMKLAIHLDYCFASNYEVLLQYVRSFAADQYCPIIGQNM